MSLKAHPTAIIDPRAELGSNVEIGPYCVIGPDVKIGDGSRLHSHVVVTGITRLGKENVLFPFVCLGAEPQDLSYKNEATRVEIGDRNIFRESSTVHRGTAKDRTVTTIGDDNFFMAQTHVAHDCLMGNGNLMANSTALAGHVIIEDHVVLGGLSAVVQKCRVGSYSFIGASTIIRKDLPPFMAAKEFSAVSGPNLVGLRRRKFPDEEIRAISEVYKIFYLGHLKTEEALAAIEGRFPESTAAKRFIEFVRNTKVGVQR